MIRIVSFRKAIMAGVAGALAWELVLRALQLLGLPLFDIVQVLGTLAAPEGAVLGWWTAGLFLHAMVGALWAIFYAYFFWSWFDWRPALQGLVFSAIPIALAMFVAYPQLQLMHAQAPIVAVDPIGIFRGLGWREPTGLVLGHLIYGAVLGTLYTRPAGYRVGRAVRMRSQGAGHRSSKPARPATGFLFATGIECSYPTIEGGRWRCDQMEATGHYRHWRDDLALCQETGVTHLRYGPPLHLIHQGPGRYDWTFTDPVMAEMREKGPQPIIDLCHFGVPDWLENFQNPAVPEQLRDYAQAFAQRYDWVRFYTPVNEMYVCAKLSALDGVWNEQRRDERSFVTAVRHLARANVLMMQAILAGRPDAVFINSESGEFYQPCCPDPEIVRIADFENERRFLPLDLLYAQPVSETMRRHLADNGMPPDEYEWFMAQTAARRAILGVDYYEWNEKLIDSDGNPQALGELFGWYVVANQYYERYRRPMMHTETNRLDARDAPRWLWRQWHNVQLLRKAGVPLVGFTWYSLIDQCDWDIAMARPLGRVNPVGLFDLNRDPRPVGLSYRHLIEIHRDQPGFTDGPGLAALFEGRAER
jgi:beta-glucosidase/6-phospho-beta-glucosidase/beta-galactosidase